MVALENQQSGVAMGQSLSQDEKIYFKTLGARIAQRREELDLTQQTYAAYEVGRHRLPVSLLPVLSEVLSIEVEVLLGMAAKNAKRGPAPKYQQQIEQISRLPKPQQRMLTDVIDGLLLKFG